MPVDAARHGARIRATFWAILVVAALLATVEGWLASRAAHPQGLWVLCVGTLAFAGLFLPALRAVAAGRLERAVFLGCANILGIQALYVVFYPRVYAAISIASFVVVGLALSFVSGRRLLQLVVVSGSVAIVAVLWGILGRPLVDIPADADAPVLMGASLAAVIVGLVLLYTFAQTMDQALADARLAHADLSAAHDTLREAERMKSQFINSAAHELNTPMTPVMLQMSLLKAGAWGTLPPEQARSLQVVERNLDRMSALVREMLDVARLQAGRLVLRREPFALRPLLGEAMEDYVAVARAKDLHLGLAAGEDLDVAADRQRVSQVVSNLLSNAIRLTPKGGRVSVEARSDGEGVEVAVQDTGIGLSPEQLGALFQPFTRIHDVSGGTGLGLYICRGLVEEMGGRLWAESPGVGRGATFRFTLPKPRAEADPDA